MREGGRGKKREKWRKRKGEGKTEREKEKRRRKGDALDKKKEVEWFRLCEILKREMLKERKENMNLKRREIGNERKKRENDLTLRDWRRGEKGD